MAKEEVAVEPVKAAAPKQPNEKELQAAANKKAEADLAALDPEKRETHPAVDAISGSACQVKGCGYIFGDKVFGLEPHPIRPIVPKQVRIVGPESFPKPPPPPPAASDKNVCQIPVTLGNDCSACGWKHDSVQPHPLTLV